MMNDRELKKMQQMEEIFLRRGGEENFNEALYLYVKRLCLSVDPDIFFPSHLEDNERIDEVNLPKNSNIHVKG